MHWICICLTAEEEKSKWQNGEKPKSNPMSCRGQIKYWRNVLIKQKLTNIGTCIAFHTGACGAYRICIPKRVTKCRLRSRAAVQFSRGFGHILLARNINQKFCSQANCICILYSGANMAENWHENNVNLYCFYYLINNWNFAEFRNNKLIFLPT